MISLGIIDEKESGEKKKVKTITTSEMIKQFGF